MAERRERFRRPGRKYKKAKIANRVWKFAEDDRQARARDRDARIQRYAKLRGWTEGKEWPWEGSSDVSFMDIMTSSLHMHDTLHNAVMSTRPAVASKAHKRHDEGQQDTLDHLLDYQFFVEQPGEKVLEDFIMGFVDDGSVVAFIPWVREHRNMLESKVFPPLPPDLEPREYFLQILAQEFEKALPDTRDEEGWEWEVAQEEGEPIRVSFYTTRDGEVEMVTTESVQVYDGPRVIVKDYEDVLTPARVANCQRPGPSNPGGAAHVILVDHPTIDEIAQLQADGTYDLIDKSEVKKLEELVRDKTEEQEKEQIDVMQGEHEVREERIAPSHRTLTRYVCFDMYDLDGDGRDEDVIWWVLKENKLLLRVKPLTELYPAKPPRRPLAEAQFIPVKKRRQGIGLPELMEGLHDFQKELLDQMVDGGTLALTPFGFYRATSNVKPETIRLWPGEVYPLSDPSRDIAFPSLANPAANAQGLNLLSMGQQWSEKLTMQGELQLGRVPAGRSSALRTLGGIQTLLSQGEARPERILRRFFMGLTEIWAQMHELNKSFLPRGKQFRVAGYAEPGADPYRVVEEGGKQFTGRFDFDFRANVMNASKVALQESLRAIMGVMISPLAIQAGVSTPDTIYRLLRDYTHALGQHPDTYLNRPSPESSQPPILAEEAISMILDGQMPIGRPMEGAVAHLQKLKLFIQSDDFGHVDTEREIEILRGYLEQTARLAQEEMKRSRLAQASDGGPAPQAGQPPGSPQGTPPVQANELTDETLPTAGGGGADRAVQ